MIDKISLTCDCGKVIWINIRQLKEDVKEELLKGELKPIVIEELLNEKEPKKQEEDKKEVKKQEVKINPSLEKNLMDDETREILSKFKEGAIITQFIKETGTSKSTARTRLNRLCELGLANRKRTGRDLIYKIIIEEKQNEL